MPQLSRGGTRETEEALPIRRGRAVHDESRKERMNHSDMKIRDAQIIELRKLNKSVSEIAEALGVTYGVVSYACKRYGYDGKRSDRKADYTNGGIMSGR